MPKASAFLATFCPMRPMPTMPSVLPSSVCPKLRIVPQMVSFLVRSVMLHSPTRRLTASINAMACSAVGLQTDTGVFVTAMFLERA